MTYIFKLKKILPRFTTEVQIIKTKRYGDECMRLVCAGWYVTFVYHEVGRAVHVRWEFGTFSWHWISK